MLNRREIHPSKTKQSLRLRLIATAAIIVVLSSLAWFWPWLWPEDAGYVLIPHSKVWESDSRVQSSVWQARNGRVLLRVETDLGPLDFTIDPRGETIGLIGYPEPRRIGPWLIVHPRSIRQSHYSNAPGPVTAETLQMQVRDNTAEVHVLGSRVVLELRSSRKD